MPKKNTFVFLMIPKLWALLEMRLMRLQVTVIWKYCSVT